MSTTLILIRHGQTDANKQRRYCGAYDCDLNENGRAQARKLNELLRKEVIDQVYSSDLERAMQFSKKIFGDKKINVLSDLREIDFGIFDGLTHEEIMG